MIHGEADERFGPLVTGRTRLGSRTAGRTISLAGVPVRPARRDLDRVQAQCADRPPAPVGRLFRSDGASGQLAFADAEARLGFAYINGSIRYPDDRVERLALALRDCLKV
jgi:hypothetical protein